jgi:bifunctional non-homologous end joining protein LigD
MVGNEMDDLAYPLHPLLHGDHGGAEDDATLAFVERLPDHQVGDPALDLGFKPGTVTDVRKRLAPLVQKDAAFSRKIKKPNAVWVKPALLAEVEYRAKSAERKLRHPSFKELREDL